MRWFRDNIGHGSWLALFALAINVALSFGHVHAIGGHHSERGLILAHIASSDSQTQGHSDDSKTDDLCPICMATAAIGTGVTPMPPALPVEFAETAIGHATEWTVAIPPGPRAAFQSRGPPIS